MGRHWFEPLLEFFLTRKKLPSPELSFSIKVKQDEKEKAINIDLGPHTKLEDIEEVWPAIDRLKKLVWPSTKQLKISDTTIENFLIWRDDLIRRGKWKDKKLEGRMEWQRLYRENDEAAADLERFDDNCAIYEVWPYSDEDDECSDLNLGISEKRKLQKLRKIRSRGNKMLR